MKTVPMQFNGNKPLTVSAAIRNMHFDRFAGEVENVWTDDSGALDVTVSGLRAIVGMQTFRASYLDLGNGKVRVWYRGHQHTINKVKACDKCGAANNFNNDYCRICAHHKFI